MIRRFLILLIACSSILFSSCDSDDLTAAVPPSAVTNPMKIPTVLFYFAHWCGYCKMTMPVMDSLKTKYNGKVFFQYVDIDSPEGKEIGNKYRPGGGGVPYMQFYDKAGKLLGETLGAVGEEKLDAKIKASFGL